jgi:hypothetical protein
MSQMPAQYNIAHYRGDTFDKSFAFKTATEFDSAGNPTEFEAVDMTGGTLLAQLRLTADLSSPVIATFEILDYVPAEGTWRLHLDADELALVTWSVSHYDVQFTNAAGAVQTLFYGEFDMTADVSRLP